MPDEPPTLPSAEPWSQPPWWKSFAFHVLGSAKSLVAGVLGVSALISLSIQLHLCDHMRVYSGSYLLCLLFFMVGAIRGALGFFMAWYGIRPSLNATTAVVLTLGNVLMLPFAEHLIHPAVFSVRC